MRSDASTGCAGPSGSEPAVTATASAAAVAPTDLRHLVRVYDADLPGGFCTRLVQSFHALERLQQRNGRGVRAGLDESAWTELDLGRHADAEFLGFFRHRISGGLARYNRDVSLPMPVPDSPLLAPLILKRYAADGAERFQLHFDSVNGVCDRYLVFLWYLNDVRDAGQTSFPLLDLHVAPRAGRLLMFPPYWMFAHEGRASPTQDKYILSTYLRFPSPLRSGASP
ncbi:MAG: 2OG-Fe(II) oxygenase [Luteimonas sp.]|nr:2OG-Fe(II) oxygenase [Luteimonas sp.]